MIAIDHQRIGVHRASFRHQAYATATVDFLQHFTVGQISQDLIAVRCRDFQREAEATQNFRCQPRSKAGLTSAGWNPGSHINDP